MDVVNKFIWNIFEEPSSVDRKTVSIVNVYISDFTGATAYTNGNNINISALVIQFFPPGKGKFIFNSIMYHEMTHVFQWYGNGTAPLGLTEGIADYVMVKSKFYDPNTYTRPGAGSRWDVGYGVTERFLEYCDSLRNGFTVALNKKMRYQYNDSYFFELLGKPLDQVWREYKAKYGNVPASESMLPDTNY
ncbi:Plant basic secretory protein (BSP) family protein [Forsythia ovata]|uniref:Plant basic secretory protein (BSP) family protein n=1 Tax=Forsythia ovata TaxID=205694 RepID=A0ABD1QM41_9LAMI